MRPLATIIHDSLSSYGQDEHGGRCHDLLGTRCDPYINSVLSGEEYDFHCHSNLVRAVMPWGLAEGDVHDVINIFQVTGLDERGRYFMNPCPAEKRDCIQFLAEQDLLMALSEFAFSLPSNFYCYATLFFALLNISQAHVPEATFHFGALEVIVNRR